MKNIVWKIIHWIIIINFLLEIGYGSYMVFIELGMKIGRGPLFGKAAELIANNYPLMAARRLYAIETWIAIAGLSIYLAVVEFLPQKLEALQKRNSKG